MTATLLALVGAPEFPAEAMGPTASIADYRLPNPWHPAPARPQATIRLGTSSIDPTHAAVVSLAGPLLMIGTMVLLDHFGSGGNVSYVWMEVSAFAPLSLWPGYACAGNGWRGAAVVAGAYAAEALGGAAVAAWLMSGQSNVSDGFQGLVDVAVGSTVGLGLYSLWAVFDTYQTARMH